MDEIWHDLPTTEPTYVPKKRRIKNKNKTQKKKQKIQIIIEKRKA